MGQPPGEPPGPWLGLASTPRGLVLGFSARSAPLGSSLGPTVPVSQRLRVLYFSAQVHFLPEALAPGPGEVTHSKPSRPAHN